MCVIHIVYESLELHDVVHVVLFVLTMLYIVLLACMYNVITVLYMTNNIIIIINKFYLLYIPEHIKVQKYILKYLSISKMKTTSRYLTMIVVLSRVKDQIQTV